MNAKDPTVAQSFHSSYSPEAKEILEKEGPKYQYGNGCLSDGVLGSWLSRMCGMEETLNTEKVKSHLLSVHRYNFKKDLTDHANPQRSPYALGKEGGLLLGSWPKGGKLSLPFVYSNEVWTGIEYQVASHLMLQGEVEKALRSYVPVGNVMMEASVTLLMSMSVDIGTDERYPVMAYFKD